MIRTSHLNAALALTSKLDGMGYRLLPIGNTPLATLNADLCVPMSGSADWQPVPEHYVSAAMSVTPGQDYSVYTANMDQTARTIAAYVQSHLSFAKNVVKPIITELVECFTEKVQNTNISPFNDFKIVKRELPLPMLNSDVKDAVDDYARVEISSVEYPQYNAPDKNIIEIVELMKTGNKKADEAIDTWVATVGDAEIAAAYERVFCGPKGTYPKNRVIGVSRDSWDSTLAVFLMARNLHNKPWEGCSMSLVNYNVSMGNLRDWAGSVLAAIYKTYGNNIRTGLLAPMIYKNTVEVNAPIYNEWIEAGNSDLLLFGAAVRGMQMAYVSEINDAKVELMRAWELHSAMASASERNRKYSLMKKTLHECVFQVIEHNATSVFGHLNNQNNITDHVDTKEYKTFRTAFDAYYNTITEADFVDFWCTAKRIVCDMLFYYTDAGEILDGIEDACKTNPALDVDEAALLSTIKYVSKYVSSQMVISKI